VNLSRRLQILGMSSALSCLALWSGAGAATPDEQAWREECSACHIAYPARFLPAASWQEIMRTLNDHFGADASVDAATAEKISRYLASAARSPSRTRAASSPLRITETRWFVHEHDEISVKQWRSPQVKSPANCGACHQDAEAGRFGERSLRIPK
jgi:diheme cytochrome c